MKNDKVTRERETEIETGQTDRKTHRGRKKEMVKVREEERGKELRRK